MSARQPSLRLVLAGRWTYGFYEDACAHALERCGVQVIPFRWARYLQSPLGRFEEKWTLPGWSSARLNRDLGALVAAETPDVVWIWRGTLVQAATVRRIRARNGALTMSSVNDDPFGPQQHGKVPMHHHRLWRNYIACARECDLNFVYRQSNVSELIEAGASHAEVLKPYFVPEIHYPPLLTDEERRRYGCDVVFVGHYEDDGRLDYLNALVDAGLHVRLFGPRAWRERLGSRREYFGDVDQVLGHDYAKALFAARMALCFLSRMNRDTYTRRCFEIPACGGVLLSERTADLQQMYQEDREAVFFSNVEELVKKALWLRDNPSMRDAVAAAGRDRVLHDGHVDVRMRQVIRAIESRLA